MNYKLIGIPYRCYKCPRFQISLTDFTMFHCKTVVSQLDLFETSAPNDSKMTLHPRRSQMPQLCVTGVPESQHSVLFLLQPAVPSYKPFLRQLNDPKWPWTLQGHRFSMQLMFQGPKFHPILFYKQDLSRHKILDNWKNAQNDPRMALND